MHRVPASDVGSTATAGVFRLAAATGLAQHVDCAWTHASRNSLRLDLLVDRFDSFTDVDLIPLLALSIIPNEIEFLQLSEAWHVSCPISLLRKANGKKVTDYEPDSVDRISCVVGGWSA